MEPFVTGACVQAGVFVGARGTVRFPGRAFYDAPDSLVFDTGYAPRLVDATRAVPERAYRFAAPFELQAPLVEQLPASEVGMIVLSHLHPDHVAGLLDYPDALVLVSRRALEAVPRSRLGRLKAGILDALIPSDLERRATFIEDLPRADFDGFEAYLLGDRRLVSLPGHAPGQFGLLDRDRFYVADALYSARDAGRPLSLAQRLVAHDPRAAAETQRTLASLDVELVATHEYRSDR